MDTAEAEEAQSSLILDAKTMRSVALLGYLLGTIDNTRLVIKNSFMESTREGVLVRIIETHGSGESSFRKIAIFPLKAHKALKRAFCVLF